MSLLEELRRLHEAGAPRPWKAVQNPIAGEGYVNLPDGESFPCFNCASLTIDDADLIAAMRNALPLLLDLWEAAEGDCAEHKGYGSPRSPRVSIALNALQEEAP